MKREKRLERGNIAKLFKVKLSGWENLLGPGFLRVHRSFLVSIADATITAPDVVFIGSQEIPVSRKYKESVKAVLETSL